MTTPVSPKNSEAEGNKRSRLTLDLPPELHLRLKLTAAHEHRTMREYVERLLDREVPPLPSPPASARDDVSRAPAATPETAERLRSMRHAIAHGHPFATSSVDVLREVREEREDGEG